MADILMMITMPLPLLIAGVFWHAANRRPDSRSFVIPLIVGWVVGLTGSVAWGVHDVLSSNPLPAFSWVDGFFISREVLHLLAFLQIASVRVSRRQVAIVSFAVLAASAAMLVGYAGLRPAERSVSLAYWGGAIYPVLGIAVLGVAVMRWRVVEDRVLRRTAGWVIVALLLYFAANVAQFASLVIRQSGSDVALWLWPLSDLVALIGAISLVRGKSS